MGLMVSEKLKFAPDASDTNKLSVNEGPVSVKLSDTVIVGVRVSLIADMVSVKLNDTVIVGVRVSLIADMVSVKLNDTVIVGVRVSLIADMVSVKVKLTEPEAIIIVETVWLEFAIPTPGAVYVIEQVPAEPKL
jgi:hypothetical protein